MQVVIAAVASHDERRHARPAVDGETLVVMNMLGDRHLGRATDSGDGLGQDLHHYPAAAVVGVERMDRVVHCHQQRLVSLRRSQLGREPVLLIPLHFATFGHIGVKADAGGKKGAQGPAGVRLGHCRAHSLGRLWRMLACSPGAEIEHERNDREFWVHQPGAVEPIAVAIVRDRQDRQRAVLVRRTVLVRRVELRVRIGSPRYQSGSCRPSGREMPASQSALATAASRSSPAATNSCGTESRTPQCRRSYAVLFRLRAAWP